MRDPQVSKIRHLDVTLVNGLHQYTMWLRVRRAFPDSLPLGIVRSNEGGGTRLRRRGVYLRIWPGRNLTVTLHREKDRGGWLRSGTVAFDRTMAEQTQS